MEVLYSHFFHHHISISLYSDFTSFLFLLHLTSTLQLDLFHRLDLIPHFNSSQATPAIKDCTSLQDSIHYLTSILHFTRLTTGLYSSLHYFSFKLYFRHGIFSSEPLKSLYFRTSFFATQRNIRKMIASFFCMDSTAFLIMKATFIKKYSYLSS